MIKQDQHGGGNLSPRAVWRPPVDPSTRDGKRITLTVKPEPRKSL